MIRVISKFTYLYIYGFKRSKKLFILNRNMKRYSLSYKKRKRKSLSKTYSKKQKIEQEGGGSYSEEAYFIRFPN